MLVASIVFVFNLVYLTDTSSKLTKMTFYQQRVSWNVAEGICRETGGRLPEPKSLSMMDILSYYSFSFLFFLGSSDKYWIGMAKKSLEQEDFVFADSCQSAKQMNVIRAKSDDLCVMLDSVFQIMYTEQCSKNKLFFCVQILGDQCGYEYVTYSIHENQDISINISQVYNSSSSECEQICDTSVSVYLSECWAYAFDSDTDTCEIYYSSHHIIDAVRMSTFLPEPKMIKRCYQVFTADTNADPMGSNTPNVQCADEVFTTISMTSTTDATSMAKLKTETIAHTTVFHQQSSSPTTSPTHATPGLESTIERFINISTRNNASVAEISTEYQPNDTRSINIATTLKPKIINTTAPPTTTNKGICSCYIRHSVDDKDVLNEMYGGLVVKKSELSSMVRKYISVQDPRLSVAVIGFGGIVFLVIFALVLVVFDLLSAWQAYEKNTQHT